jgi:hypothetical protein
MPEQNADSTLDKAMINVEKKAPTEVRDFSFVTNKTIIRTVDRSPKDILTWRTALQAAESVYYPNQSRLFDLYDDIRSYDGHLNGIIQKRIDQVLNKNLLFKKGDEPVTEMEKTIKGDNFRRIITELMMRKMRGISAMEFVPGNQLSMNVIPPKHIKLKTQLITFEQFGLNEGIDYTKAKNLWVLGDHHDFGLLLVCGYYSLLKRGAISDWATYIELFGSPVIVLKYDGYNKDDKIAGQKIIDSSGNAQKLLIPRTMDWDMKDGKISNGDGKLQETFRLAMNQEQSLIVLGNTETSASGQHGSEGKSKTHSEQQKEIMKSDMAYILDCLNSDKFMSILQLYNLPVEGGYFEYDKEVDVEYLEKFVPLVVSLGTQLGLGISKKYLYDLTGMPDPDTEEDTIQLYPTLGQQIPSEPDDVGANPRVRPNPAKPKNLSDNDGNQPVTLNDVKTLLKDFFDPARS